MVYDKTRFAQYGLALLGVVVGSMYAPPVSAEIYKYKTPSGRVLVTNQPKPDYELLSVVSAEGPGSSKHSDSSTDSGEANRAESSKQGDRSASHYDEIIGKAAKRYNVPKAFIKAVIRVESNFDPRAVSPAGAKGLMQLMPSTAKGLGVENPFDPKQNIFGGTRLLSNLIERYDGNIDLILAAYNAGDEAVNDYGGIPYPVTRRYVKSVNQWYRVYSGFTD